MAPDKRALVPCGVGRHRRTAVRLLLRRCREVPGSVCGQPCTSLFRQGVLLSPESWWLIIPMSATNSYPPDHL